jgi:hypothetical protein
MPQILPDRYTASMPIQGSGDTLSMRIRQDRAVVQIPALPSFRQRSELRIQRGQRAVVPWMRDEIADYPVHRIHGYDAPIWCDFEPIEIDGVCLRGEGGVRVGLLLQTKDGGHVRGAHRADGVRHAVIDGEKSAM